jgi:energy-coupling factor transporter ATP-binding protein EcfA2
MGAYAAAGRARWAENLAKIFAWFPVLAQRAKAAAGALSGGQQQMLAIARGLASSPELLMLDEPSMGLAPAAADEIFERIVSIHAESGLTVLLVEQRVAEALHFSDRGYVLEAGRVEPSACWSPVAEVWNTYSTATSMRPVVSHSSTWPLNPSVTPSETLGNCARNSRTSEAVSTAPTDGGMPIVTLPLGADPSAPIARLAPAVVSGRRMHDMWGWSGERSGLGWRGEALRREGRRVGRRVQPGAGGSARAF